MFVSRRHSSEPTEPVVSASMLKLLLTPIGNKAKSIVTLLPGAMGPKTGRSEFASMTRKAVMLPTEDMVRPWRSPCVRRESCCGSGITLPRSWTTSERGGCSCATLAADDAASAAWTLLQQRPNRIPTNSFMLATDNRGAK